MNINFSTFLFYVPQAWRITLFLAIICYLTFLLLKSFDKPIMIIIRQVKALLLLLLFLILKSIFYIIDMIVIGVYKIAPIKSKQFINSYEKLSRLAIGYVEVVKSRKHMRQFQFKKKHKRALTFFIICSSFSILTWMPKSQTAEAIITMEVKMYEQFGIEMLERKTAKQKLSDLYVYWFVDDSIAEANEVRSSSPSPVLLKLKSEYPGGNLRAEPTINGEIISVIDGGEKIYYLGTEDIDSRSVTWFEVERENGHIGWISSDIVEFIE